MTLDKFFKGRITLHHGDSREVLKTLANNSIDSIVCDPPYALVFMGKKWDTGDTAHDLEFWFECLRVLKPGGHVVALAGTRTYHRLACAIEDAGFEIRDSLSWIFGSGFPKSHNTSKTLDDKKKRCACGTNMRDLQRSLDSEDTLQHDEQSGTVAVQSESQERGAWPYCRRCGKPIIPDGLGTALKPAMELICLARKPLSEKTVAANVLRWGVGAINVDGCRVATNDSLGGGDQNPKTKIKVEGWDRPWMQDEAAKAAHAARVNANVQKSEALGRWPANVVHDGSEEVVEMFPDSNGSGSARTLNRGQRDGEGWGMADEPGKLRDAGFGSAARFFYQAKASKKERNGSKHPTVKPVNLMRYLCRLITPPKGTVLDPFAGTGTTGEAAHLEGFKCILIEREKAYVKDIRQRMIRMDVDEKR